MSGDVVRFIDNQTIIMPTIGSRWQNAKGAVRIVSDVDEVWVYYRRPAPAPPSFWTVSGSAWAEWVTTTNATRKS